MILGYVKLLCYVWAFIEIASAANLYKFAISKMTNSPIMRALFWFLVAISTEMLYRFLLNYTVILTTRFHDTFRDGVIIVLLFSAITARRFRETSLDNGNLKQLMKKGKK